MYSKGNPKQDEKTSLRKGENICKWKNWQGFNLWNTQTARGTEYQKINKQKMGRKAI